MSVQEKTKVFFLLTLLPFALIYFAIQYFVTGAGYNLLTDLDHAIPFNSHFIWIYHTFIPVIAVTLIFLLKKKDLFIRATAALLIATIILAFFYIVFPSFYPRGNFIDTQSISGYVVDLTRQLDGAHNTFPSSHVTFSWLATFFISLSACAKRNSWIKVGYIVWAILISISTLAVKQHYIVDVLAGFALAYVCFHLARKLKLDKLIDSSYLHANN